MASPLLPSPFIYGDIPGGGNLATIVVSNTSPTVSQNQQQSGSFWLVPEPQGSGNLYYLSGFVLGVPQWVLISDASQNITGINGTTNQITASPPVAGVVTLSTPTTFVAPGSVTATTKYNVTTGANASVGTTAALSGGATTVNTTAITANSLVFFTTNALGTVTVPQSYRVSARTPGTSFAIQSSDATDTSTVNYWIIN